MSGHVVGELRSHLVRAGFLHPDQALRLLEHLPGADRLERAPDLIEALRETADPDQGLRAVCRMAEAVPSLPRRFATDPHVAGLCALLGFSRGAVEFCARSPARVEALATGIATGLPDAEEIARRLNAVPNSTELRATAREILLRIAGVDLHTQDPGALLPTVMKAISSVADGVLQASLKEARSRTGLKTVPLAVFALGKTGARELNYVSDVDILFVTDDSPDGGVSFLTDATRLARAMLTVLTEYDLEPPVWEIDTNLRPEGRKGALVRTLSSYREYYRRWATNWEFQALLKARFVAGDEALGSTCTRMIQTYVWTAAQRPEFIRDAQRMRRRVIENIPAEQRERDVKLSAGGLRDVEFSAQLLQLVHGRADPELRVPATLDALAALSYHGYIGRVEAHTLAEDYRMLRVLEHRAQLRDLHRTHVLPVDSTELRVLSRSARLSPETGSAEQVWTSIRREVSKMQRAIFYQPLLDVAANLDTEQLRLSEEQARERLSALGFVASDAALAHIRALTTGVSRRAEIQRHLLPILLELLSQGTDPDYGLLAFRRVSERLGEQYWYLRMLRDSPIAAEHLCRVLSRSRYIGDALVGRSSAAAWAGDERQLIPRSRQQLEMEMRAIVSRHTRSEEHDPQVPGLLLSVRHRELLRLAMSAVAGVRDVIAISQGVSAVHAALIEALLQWIDPVGAFGIRFGVVGVGRFGGGEQGFGSDLDLLFVIEDAGAGGETTAAGQHVVTMLRDALADFQLPITLDLDLRPEGRKGPVVRTLSSTLQYYARWGEPWESQALLRASAVAGDPGLLRRYLTGIHPFRYPAHVSPEALRQIRVLKARMESERLDRGTDPALHLKLGRGSLSDVEWLVQLLQLQHAATEPSLQVVGTMDALDAEEALGLLSSSEASKLRDAWVLASRIRSAIMLASGVPGDVLPTGGALLDGVVGILGGDPSHSQNLVNEYLAVTRRARAVFERRFYAQDGR